MAETQATDSQEDAENARVYAELQRCALLRRQPAAAFKVRQWWQQLTFTPQEMAEYGLPYRAWSPGLKATLRRCETPEAAALTEGFRRIWQMQQDVAGDAASDPRIEDWACVAMVLAEIKKDDYSVSFAAEAGKENGDSGEPVVSALRFQQLQDCHTPEELVRRLRRILAMLRGSPVSVVRLADDILLWAAERRRRRWPEEPGQRLAFRWAEAYFGQVATYKSADR